jgi:hypothetical protein
VGDLLIVRKGVSISRGEKLVYNKRTRKLTIVAGSEFDADVLVIGELMEERFNVGKY